MSRPPISHHAGGFARDVLSVVVWIGALVALWIGALVWLRKQAPAELVEAAEEGVLALVGRATDAGDGAALVPAPQRTSTVPAPRPAAPPPDALASTPSGPADRPNGTPPQGKPVPNKDAIAVLTDRLELLSRLGTVHDSGAAQERAPRREHQQVAGYLLDDAHTAGPRVVADLGSSTRTDARRRRCRADRPSRVSDFRCPAGPARDRPRPRLPGARGRAR